jgi:hypothetical protein
MQQSTRAERVGAVDTTSEVTRPVVSKRRAWRRIQQLDRYTRRYRNAADLSGLTVTGRWQTYATAWQRFDAATLHIQRQRATR